MVSKIFFMSKRLKFFLTHLSTSFLVACIALGIVFFMWYPTPLAKAVGVTHIFLLMLTIDVIVGPILGFFIYREDKKSLKFDLTVIILIQLSAFLYGFYSIAQGRPVWIVYSVDRFQVIRKNDIALQPNVKVKPEYQNISLVGAKFVGVELSKNLDQKQKDMFNAVFGLTLAQQPDRYVSFGQVKQSLQKNAQDLKLLNQFNNPQLVANILNQYPSANAWVPLKANAVDMVVLLNKKSGEVVKIVDLRPWK